MWDFNSHLVFQKVLIRAGPGSTGAHQRNQGSGLAAQSALNHAD
jgi:hypothetical protein